MAKIKISELAQELGCESKEVVSFLQQQGVEAAKRSTSSVEEEQAAIARKHFDGNSGKQDIKENKAGKVNKDNSDKKTEDKKSIDKSAAKMVDSSAEKASVNNAKKPSEKAADITESSADNDAPKKKKKIIFVSNPNNSKFSGNTRPVNTQKHTGSDNSGQKSSHQRNSSFSNSQNAYHPIKPKTAPSQLESYASSIIKPVEQPKAAKNKEESDIKAASVEAVKKETSVVAAEAAVVNTPEVKPSADTAEVNTAAVKSENVEKASQTAAHAESASPAAESRSDSQQHISPVNHDGTDYQARNDGQRPYNNNAGGQRPYNNAGGQRPYNNNAGGQRPYNNNAGGQRPYNNAGGQRPYNNAGGQRPYNNAGGQRPYNNAGGQRPYNNAGGQRPYNNNAGGQRPYNNAGGQRPYNNNAGGQRPYNNNAGGQRPYNNAGGQRPYGSFQGGQRPYNNAGGGTRPYGGGAGGSRPYGQGGRPYGNSQGGSNRFGNTSSFSAPMKDGEKHRDEEKRRISQERDKRSKKDLVYEDEEKMPRSKRVGRFIRPEIKKEEIPEEQIKVISIPEKLTIKELAAKMKMQPAVIIKKLFLAGQVVTVNSELTYEEAENIAVDYDIICEKEVQVDIIEELLKEDEDSPETLVSRPPVVCVMGHVDHGKTSLLDAIRNTSVSSREAGGITQRIGAYMVTAKDRKITFLDTPGHEAFTAMRMRGANSTDIAVLVVAADDGVMPQTIEAINHAKAANVEIIVAVNKIDKPNANIDRVKQEMTEYGLVATDWGGTTEFVPVSAKTGQGIDTLLETILLTADILELKANPDRQARGLVLEAKLDKGRGPVANVLVQKGTLHIGDFISAGASSGKVRAMADDKGRRVKEATPSQPVEILGLSDVPNAGEVFICHESDKEAKQFADTYKQQHKKDLIDETKSKMSLDDLYSKIEEGKLKELDIIIKADVQGSVEALKQSLIKLSNEEVVVKVIHGGVGAINESDVTLAAASSAIIIGFNVRPDAMAKSMADHEGVEIKLYKVIYQAIDDVDAAMKGMLAPVYEEKITGHAEVRQIFKASAIGNIAGAIVLDGSLQKGCKVRISRDGEQIFEGNLSSLKRFKDDVKEVKEGYECGLVFEDFDQMREGDQVEAYIMVEIPRE